MEPQTNTDIKNQAKKKKQKPLTYKTVTVESKKGHKDEIISVSINEYEGDGNIIATSSEDQTVRLWDLRQKGAIKCFIDKQITQDMGNVIFTPKNTILVSAEKNVYSFDLKMDQIVVQNSIIQSKSDNDIINCIAIDKNGKSISAVDDAGDSTIFDPYTLEVQGILSMEHKNICYTTDFTYADQNYEKPLCVTGGFDCQLILWDMEQKKMLRKLHMAEIVQKFMSGQQLNPPVIHSIYGLQQQILVGIESGHVICFSQKDFKKPKFIIDAHISRVTRSVFAKFNESMIVNCSSDKTFSLFNQRERDQFGSPIFVKKN